MQNKHRFQLKSASNDTSLTAEKNRQTEVKVTQGRSRSERHIVYTNNADVAQKTHLNSQ